MATTTNIGLTKPAGTDKALVSVINSNSDIIDSAAGGLMDAIAIVANGNTHAAISAGQYVYVHNHGTLAEGLYTANSAIAANATLTTSNLTADASGGLNALNSNIANGHLVAKYLNDTSKTAIQLLTADFPNVNLGDIQFYRIRPSDDNLYGFIVKHSATYAYGLFAGMNTGDSYNIVNSNGTWTKTKLALTTLVEYRDLEVGTITLNAQGWVAIPNRPSISGKTLLCAVIVDALPYTAPVKVCGPVFQYLYGTANQTLTDVIVRYIFIPQ